MPLHDTAYVKGMSKLGEKLDKLPQDIKEKVARGATREAAVVALAAVQTEAPWRTGNLYRHLRISSRKDKDDKTKVSYVVFVKTTRARPPKKARGTPASGPSETSAQMPPYYWYFVEFGTSRMTANPFMLRGFLKSTDNALTRARDTAAKLIQEVT